MPNRAIVMREMTSTENHPQNPAFIQQMFGKIARRYDLANHVLSMGLDYGWRKQIAREVAALGPRLILDLATGSGDLALVLKKFSPFAEIIAADFCVPMLAQAHLKKVQNLVAADGMRLPFADGVFDVLTVSFGLRNMSSYADALKEFFRVLRPGGSLFVLDFSMPGSILRRPYRFYLRSVLPQFATVLTGEKCAYDYLGESIEAFPRGDDMIRLIRQAGVTKAEFKPLAAGIVSLYRARKNDT